MNFIEEFERFNGNYHSWDGGKRPVYLIKHYYKPEELKASHKEVLFWGLQTLVKLKIISAFDGEVFYLKKVDKRKQSEIVKMFDSTIDKVKKVTPRVERILAEKSNIVKAVFFADRWCEIDEAFFGEYDLEGTICEEASQITEEKYGIHPADIASDALMEYQVSFINSRKKAGCTAEISKDTTYIRLLKKAKAIKNSPECKEWDKAYEKESTRIYSQKNEELSKVYGCSIDEVYDVISQRPQVLSGMTKIEKFNLWGHITICWMKLGTSWFE